MNKKRRKEGRKRTVKTKEHKKNGRLMWKRGKRGITKDKQNKSNRRKKIKKGRGRRRKIIRKEEKKCKMIENLMKGDKVD
jgi:hypothetical protein